MVKVLIPFVMAIVLGIVYHFANRVDLKKKQYYAAAISFSSGLSITYVLLSLFPDFTEGALVLSRVLYFSVLFGFIVHHISEKFIYLNHPKHDIIKLLTLEEHVFYFIYHFILGILIVFFTKESIIDSLLFFIPILAYTLISSLATEPYEKWHHSWIASSATIWGVIFVTFIWTTIPLWFYYGLLGLVVGVLLYSIVRHHIPFAEKGNPFYFLVGTAVYSALVIASWML
jgi:hypothetical protein